MSKTKNTPEFQKMMDEQELALSFHYAEQEMEKQELLRDLAAEDKQDADDSVTVLRNMFKGFNPNAQ